MSDFIKEVQKALNKHKGEPLYSVYAAGYEKLVKDIKEHQTAKQIAPESLTVRQMLQRSGVISEHEARSTSINGLVSMCLSAINEAGKEEFNKTLIKVSKEVKRGNVANSKAYLATSIKNMLKNAKKNEISIFTLQ